MKLTLSQKEREQLVAGALSSAKRLGYPLKKKKNKPGLQLVPKSNR
ncbi:hypothetical protein GE107_25305 [Cohnella sp. CFH 77786]|nr:hypothetical protein [Cohnella sp. CFH 77786]MBW5449348.1 hypothetical protein [Cohnella sp. CFH 77786]